MGWNDSSLLEDYEDYEDYYVFDDPLVKVILFSLFTLVFIFCFFGNLAVVLVMRLHWRMRSVTKFCLVNLAFANLCVGVFCVYQNLSLYLMDSWIFGGALCKMYHFINSLSHTASILILVVIALERYLAILHPFLCRRVLTLQKLRVIILTVWILSALICSPRLYYIVTIHNLLPGIKGEPERYEVICSINSRLFDTKTADMMHFLLLFLLPLLIITILYSKIALFLRRSSFRKDVIVPSRRKREFRVPFWKSRTLLHETKWTWTRRVERVKGKDGSPGETFTNICCSRFSEEEIENSMTQSSRSESVEMRMGRGTSGQKSIDSTTSSRIVILRNKLTVRSRNQRSVVKMLVVIVVSFGICNFPFHARKIYQNYFHKAEFEGILTDLSTPLTFLLMYANCAINPFLYAFMSHSFRSCAKDFLKCRLRKSTSL